MRALPRTGSHGAGDMRPGVDRDDSAMRRYAGVPPAALQERRLQGADGIELTVMDLGASWLSCKVPLGGQQREVLLGCADRVARPGYIGATVGRYANRIAHGELARGNQQWPLACAPGERHQLHGGPGGMHAQPWRAEQTSRTAIRWTLESAALDQGFPGALTATLELQLPGDGSILWHCRATVSDWCPVAITSHAYFNLDGPGSDILGHRLQLAASRYAPVDAALIPLGPLADTTGTDFDFAQPTRIGARWRASAQQRLAGGYDHGWLLGPECQDGASPAARLWSSDQRLELQLFTSAPALQVYAGQHLAGVPAADGAALPACAGIALEPGFLADSPHRPQWPQPSCWIAPGACYEHSIRWRFVADPRC